MKKKKTAPKRKRNAAAATPGAAPAPSKMNRRQMMGYLQYGILGTVVIGGAGTYAATSIMSDMAERDLTRLGQGTPTVVQVHDPSCNDCSILQTEARAALRNFDDADLSYLIADLTSAEGAAFAREHGVGRVTLMLFDADGRPVDVMTGIRDRAALQLRFERFLAE